MDGAVKMPGPQIQVNTANRVQSTQNSDSGIEFIRLMQAKNDQTKTTGQEKTLQKTENKTSQSTNDVKKIRRMKAVRNLRFLPTRKPSRKLRMPKRWHSRPPCSRPQRF